MMGHRVIFDLSIAVIDGTEFAGALIILLPLAVIAATFFFVLREKVKDRRRRAFEFPASYYLRKDPPPLPEKRARKGPPDLGGRR